MIMSRTRFLVGVAAFVAAISLGCAPKSLVTTVAELDTTVTTHRRVSREWAHGVQVMLCRHRVTIDSLRGNWPVTEPGAKKCQEFLANEPPTDPDPPPPIDPGW
jgi:hypothetical protein